jgi:glycosyltransferase involved in cell wall biosynthesis
VIQFRVKTLRVNITLNQAQRYDNGMRDNVSIIIPSYNMARWLPKCLESIRIASDKCPLLITEIIIVDDGSDVENANEINELVATYNLRLIRQENKGRLEARLVGIKKAKYENILLIDSRVEIDPKAFVWWTTLAPINFDNFTSHVEYRSNQWFYGLYWNSIEKFAWIAYWIKPRQKIISAKNFEFYPKGTTCLISTKDNLLRAYTDIISYSIDSKTSNDDTLLLKNMARVSGIVISPLYRSLYTPRGNLNEFIAHTFHRGKVFADGHLFNLSIWGILYVGISILLVYSTLIISYKVNLQLLMILLGLSATMSIFARLSIRHITSLLLLSPVFISSYSAGVITGTLSIVKNHLILRRGS